MNNTNNNNTVRLLPAYVEVIAIPRINNSDEFYKEYSNNSIHYAKWLNSLNNAYPNWKETYRKKINEAVYLLYPETTAFNSKFYIELFKAHPTYYGYIIPVEKTMEIVLSSDAYDRLCDIFLKTGQRTFDVFEIRQVYK